MFVRVWQSWHADAANLLAQIRRTCQYLVRLGIAILRRTAFENVGDIDVLAFEARKGENSIEILTGTPHERLTLQVLVLSRRLTHEHHAGARIAHAKDDVRARLAKLARTAVAHDGTDLIERDLARLLARMSGNVHDTHGAAPPLSFERRPQTGAVTRKSSPSACQNRTQAHS